jgi:hypothetical protein
LLLYSCVICGHVTGRVRASGVESPDHAGDPPGEATATNTERTEAHGEGSTSSSSETAEGGEETSSAGEEGRDESPKEPSDKLAMDIFERLTSKSTLEFGAVEAGLAFDFTVPSFRVGVRESVLAEEGDKRDGTSAAGESADERDACSEAATASDNLLKSVNLLHFSVFVCDLLDYN